MEPGAVEVTHHVLAGRAGQHPLLAVRVAVDRDLEQVRALEQPLRGVPAGVCPVEQVGRGVDLDAVAVVGGVVLRPHHHDPPLVRGVPAHLGVAALDRDGDALAALVVGLERLPVVVAVVDADAVGVGEDHDGVVGTRLQTRGVVLVDHASAGEQRARVHVRLQGDRLLRPVDQVLAGRVAPVHGVPGQAVRVVLVEEVVLAVGVHQAVRVVHPALLGAEVELAAIRLGVRRGLVGELGVVPHLARGRRRGRQQGGQAERHGDHQRLGSAAYTHISRSGSAAPRVAKRLWRGASGDVNADTVSRDR